MLFHSVSGGQKDGPPFVRRLRKDAIDSNPSGKKTPLSRLSLRPLTRPLSGHLHAQASRRIKAIAHAG